MHSLPYRYWNRDKTTQYISVERRTERSRITKQCVWIDSIYLLNQWLLCRSLLMRDFVILKIMMVSFFSLQTFLYKCVLLNFFRQLTAFRDFLPTINKLENILFFPNNHKICYQNCKCYRAHINRFGVFFKSFGLPIEECTQ